MATALGTRVDVISQEFPMAVIDAGLKTLIIPILVLSGTRDEFYGGVSSIYRQKNRIKNPRCRFMLMDKPGKNGHYDYLLSDEAIELRAKYSGEEIKVDDIQLYSDIDIDLFEEMHSFLEQYKEV